MASNIQFFAKFRNTISIYKVFIINNIAVTVLGIAIIKLLMVGPL